MTQLSSPVALEETVVRSPASRSFLARAALRDRPPTLRPRFLYKALDAVLTSSLRAPEPGGRWLRLLLSPGSANYDRVGALIRTADQLRSGSAVALSRRLLNTRWLPLRSHRLELMDYGSGATVFLLTSQSQKQVLKIYRRSLGHSQRRLDVIADVFREKHATVSRWYNGVHRLVPPAAFFILHAPLLGAPAVGVLQTYVTGVKRDLFTGLPKAELLRLLKEDQSLRSQFCFFTQRTFQACAQEGRCLDLVGAENVLLVTEEGAGGRLVIIDNGIFEIERLERELPATLSVVQSRLAWLRSVYMQLNERVEALPELTVLLPAGVEQDVWRI